MMIKGNELAMQILAAMGEDPKTVVSMTIRFRADKAPTVVLQKLVTVMNAEVAENIAHSFQRYELKAR